MAAAFNWTAALRDLRAERAAAAAQEQPAPRRRPAPFRYAYGAPFETYELRLSNHIGPRDVLDASAFERRR